MIDRCKFGDHSPPVAVIQSFNDWGAQDHDPLLLSFEDISVPAPLNFIFTAF